MSTKEAQLQELPVAKIKPATDNPRSKVGNVDDLAASIKSSGVLEPLIVMQRNGHYDVVAGHRRLAGAKKAGLKTVPAIVRDFTEQERQEVMLIENLQREDLSPLEEARAYQRLTELGLSQRELAKRVGRTQPHISKRLALLVLPAHVQKELDAGGITIEDGVALARLTDNPKRIDRAIGQRHGWGGIPQAVARQLEELERAAKVNAAIERAQKGKIPFVKAIRGDAWSLGLPENYQQVGEGAWNSIDIAPAKHATEPCHAITVHPYTGKVVPICTEPARHGKKDSDRQPLHAGRSSQDDKEFEEIKTANAQRRAFLRELVMSKKLPKADAVRLALQAFVRESVEYGGIDDGGVAELLGFDVDEHGNLDFEFGETSPIVEYAAKGETELLRVAIAVAFMSNDERIGFYWNPGDADQEYFAFLEQHGYELTSIEAKKLGRKKSTRKAA